MAVEGCTESLLVEMVTDETDAATQDKQAVKSTDLIQIQLSIKVI
jgi:hypothetical protein